MSFVAGVLSGIANEVWWGCILSSLGWGLLRSWHALFWVRSEIAAYVDQIENQPFLGMDPKVGYYFFCFYYASKSALFFSLITYFIKFSGLLTSDRSSIGHYQNDFQIPSPKVEFQRNFFVSAFTTMAQRNRRTRDDKKLVDNDRQESQDQIRQSSLSEVSIGEQPEHSLLQHEFLMARYEAVIANEEIRQKVRRTFKRKVIRNLDTLLSSDDPKMKVRGIELFREITNLRELPARPVTVTIQQSDQFAESSREDGNPRKSRAARRRKTE